MQHWRGNVSLGRAFWLGGASAYVGLLFVALGVRDLQAGSGKQPLLGGAILLAASCALFTWYGVGVWRAAGRRIREGGGRLIPLAARGSLILIPLSVVGAFGYQIRRVRLQASAE